MNRPANRPAKAARDRTPDSAELDRWHMARALDLATLGAGRVEPNPLVGCLIARGAEIVGEGYHRRFGGPHAEIEALAIAGPRARDATVYVTLEPCCHHGKTPPCTEALIAAGVRRVVAAQQDPFPQVAGAGLATLERAGIHVQCGVLAEEAARLNAPYLKLVHTGRPWVIAKWAMTLDGKLASRTGDSRWISTATSRQIVHTLRGQVDCILIGRGTAETDDPLLTPRPPGPRTPLRIVVDSRASLASASQLVRTAGEYPLLVAAGPQAAEADRRRLTAAGCEVLVLPGTNYGERLDQLLTELGRRRLTNVLVEGGARLLGSLFDTGQIDYVHAFIAPVLVGGSEAASPLAGEGLERIAQSLRLAHLKTQTVEHDLYVQGFVSGPDAR